MAFYTSLTFISFVEHPALCVCGTRCQLAPPDLFTVSPRGAGGTGAGEVVPRGEAHPSVQTGVPLRERKRTSQAECFYDYFHFVLKPQTFWNKLN